MVGFPFSRVHGLSRLPSHSSLFRLRFFVLGLVLRFEVGALLLSGFWLIVSIIFFAAHFPSSEVGENKIDEINLILTVIDPCPYPASIGIVITMHCLVSHPLCTSWPLVSVVDWELIHPMRRTRFEGCMFMKERT